MGAPILRLSYNPSIPFSKRVTALLCCFYIAGFIGLFIWNFFTSAYIKKCDAYASGNFIEDQCSKTPLEFARPYYTRPVSNADASGQIGTFPWTPLGFGNGDQNGPLDYSVLTFNWSANALQCVMYEQYLTLHLDSEGSTVNSCYYCGPNLRILCTTIDSERSQIPVMSSTSYLAILNQFSTLSQAAHGVATTLQTGATALSVIVKTQRKVDGLQSGILPYDANTQEVSMGTDTVGPIIINAQNANSAIANVATVAASLSTLVEQATSLDLQPADFSQVQQRRTLQASYICQDCKKTYKPTLEIITILITGIFAVLTPAFTVAKLIAEWCAPEPETIYDPAHGAYISKVNSMGQGGMGPPTPMVQNYNNGSNSPPPQGYMPQQPYQYYPAPTQ